MLLEIDAPSANGWGAVIDAAQDDWGAGFCGCPVYWDHNPRTAAGIRAAERDALTREGLEDLGELLCTLDALPWSHVRMSDERRDEMEWGMAYGRGVLDGHEGEVPEPPLVPETDGDMVYLYQWIAQVRRMMAEGELEPEEVPPLRTNIILTSNPLPVPPMGRCPVCIVNFIVSLT